MLWIGILIGTVLGFVGCALFASGRISELEAQLGRGPMCSACKTDAALQSCRADCLALEETLIRERRSKAQIAGHNARLMNGFLYPKRKEA